jgi:hypothetical protein
VNAIDFREFTQRVKDGLPDGREKAIVLTKLDEARLWAAEALRNAEAVK